MGDTCNQKIKFSFNLDINLANNMEKNKNNTVKNFIH